MLAGEFGSGDRLPGEPELARSLGVSRSSLRAAIALLEEDGLVRRLHGSGTYVTDRPLLRNDLSRNFGVSSMIAAMGFEPGTVDETCALEPAAADVAEALGVEPGEPVSALRRVRTAGGRRVVDMIDWCRADVLTPAAMAAVAGASIYPALGQRGLAVPRGTLLLNLWQVDSTAAGAVALVSREHHLADAFEITVYRRGPGDGGE